MAHFQDGFIGRLQWNCTLKETEALSLCTDSHLPPALLSLCQMVERRFFTKWHGSPCSFMAQGSPYPRIPFQVTAGRWMEPGIWGCIVLLLLLFVCVHLFFFSLDVGTFSSRSRWDHVYYPVECASRAIGHHQTRVYSVYTSETHCHNNVAGSLSALVDT